MSKKLINLMNITKSYGDNVILDDLSLYIRENEFITLLGPSGCGKTTTLRIIGGFETPDKGQVLFDGKDITALPPNERDLNTVFQKYALFPHMSIAENIAFGLEERIQENPSIRDSIQQAARDACIHDNIMDFPEGYLTMVGERGVTLSGGQKQRSAIARALLKDSSILILDDSLSAVDTDTEEQILDNLLRIRRGKTTIVIAHRISTLQKSDHVAVLTEGRLAEYCTHEELIAKNGFYSHICEKQQLEAKLQEM